MDANFAFKYHACLISITFIHLFFYFHSCIFSIFTNFDTLNVGFVGTLSYEINFDFGSKVAVVLHPIGQCQSWPLVNPYWKAYFLMLSINLSGCLLVLLLTCSSCLNTNFFFSANFFSFFYFLCLYFFFLFLVACTRLYNPLFLSVCQSVCWSVRQTLLFLLLKVI